MRKIFAAAVMAASLMVPAAASAEPLDDSCALVDALARNGAEGGLKQLTMMAQGWKDQDVAKLEPMMAPVLRRFDYAGGTVYEVAGFGDSLQEHFIVMNLKRGGSVYIRVLYEGNGTRPPSFVNIDFQSKYYDIMAKPLAQPPVRLRCN